MAELRCGEAGCAFTTSRAQALGSHRRFAHRKPSTDPASIARRVLATVSDTHVVVDDADADDVTVTVEVTMTADEWVVAEAMAYLDAADSAADWIAGQIGGTLASAAERPDVQTLVSLRKGSS